MGRRALIGWTVLATTFAGASGCSGGSAAPTGFVAQNIDFRGYKSWTSFTLDSTTPGGSTHVSGERTVYINHLPPSDATEFPIGTIIVKETAADGKIFARAKRGADVNPTGAVNWEWFELEVVQTVTGIHWRGNGPPSGEIYGGDPNGGCNLCHKLAVSNDYVLTPALRLAGASDAGVALPDGGGADGDPADGGGGDGGELDGAADADAVETTLEAGVDAGAETGSDETSHE
jgi:hypothetical protein